MMKNRRISSAHRQLQARGKMRPAQRSGCLARGELFIASGNGYARAARNDGCVRATHNTEAASRRVARNSHRSLLP